MSRPAGSLLFTEESHDLPLVRFEVALRQGAAEDPTGSDGLANFATELMARGAAGRTRAELDAAFDALGTSLDMNTDHDSTSFEVTVLREKLEPALALCADVLLRPDFPDTEAHKLKRELKAQLDELRDDDGQLARRFFQRALFGDHPYGRMLLGTESSLDALRAKHARGWHARAVTADKVIFGLAGAVRPAEAEELLDRHFGSLPASPAGAPTAYPAPPRVDKTRWLLVDKPERTQSQILIGQPTLRWAHPDYLALLVATTAFGGTFTARLMDEVRSKRGLSYGASARIGHGRGQKALVIHVFPSLEQTPETLELVLRLYREWVTDGLTAAEVEFARGYLASSFAFSLATPEDRLDLRTAVELAGLPAHYIAQFAERVRSVTLEDTRRALAEQLTANGLQICVVSSAEELMPELTAAGLVEEGAVEVVDYDSL